MDDAPTYSSTRGSISSKLPTVCTVVEQHAQWALLWRVRIKNFDVRYALVGSNVEGSGLKDI